MSSGNELMELIATLRVSNHVGSLNRLLELVKPFASATVRIYSKEHHAYWRADGVGYVTDPAYAGVWSLYDAWRTTRHLGDEKRIVLELVRPEPARDHRPTNLEAVDRAARRFADLQRWEWDLLHETDDTTIVTDGDPAHNRIAWSRNRCRDAVFQSVRLYREEEKPT